MFSVQNRETDVDRNNSNLIFIDEQNALVAAVRGNNSGAQILILLPFLIGDFIDRTGIFYPAAILGDADGQYFIIFRHIPKYRLDRHQRDFMFAGHPAKQYGNSDFFLVHEQTLLLPCHAEYRRYRNILYSALLFYSDTGLFLTQLFAACFLSIYKYKNPYLSLYHTKPFGFNWCIVLFYIFPQPFACYNFQQAQPAPA